MTEATERLYEGLEDEELRLVQNAAIGADIKDARDKAAFILLFSEARQAAVKARSALCKVDPLKWREVQRLQNEVARFEDMADWLRSAIIEGEQALQQLHQIRGSGENDETEQQE